MTDTHSAVNPSPQRFFLNVGSVLQDFPAEHFIMVEAFIGQWPSSHIFHLPTKVSIYAAFLKCFAATVRVSLQMSAL